MKKILLVCAACLPLATSAFAHQVGEVFGDQMFLYEEPVEGVYKNYWSATQVPLRPEPFNRGLINVEIIGEGKTVEFKGSMMLNCAKPAASFWHYAENFGQEDQSVVPAKAIANLRKLFCHGK